MGQRHEEPMPIAVVGLACRFPGDATSPEKFWDFICKGRSAHSEIPKNRFNIDAFYHPSSKRQGTINVRGGYFLKQDIAAFDAPFFSMTAEEAVSTDPQQRLLLEVAYESIENAGIPISQIAGTNTSCYVGAFMKDYQHISSHDPDDLPGYASTGHSSALLANRISWFFDLRGSSVTIDTGCSGSTVAFHMACESLRTGEAEIAIAGGVGAILSPDPMFSMVAFNFLSPDGRCHSFDARANGYARGEGFAALVLKPLAAALRAGDAVRAVVRGSAVNQDGRTPGITLPSSAAQRALIATAYRRARLDTERTAFCEAHGTGTVAGDGAELRALAAGFGRRGGRKLLVGSVKTGIGHLEGCAGLAGILKCVLAVERGCVPPNLWFESSHPDNDLEEFGIEIPTKLTPWPTEGVRRASVNCFGFGGQSCHVILDDAHSFLAGRGLDAAPVNGTNGAGFPSYSDPRLFVWSSPEAPGVARLVEVYREYLDEKGETPGVDGGELLRDLSYTLINRRSVFSWRAAAVASSMDELRERLRTGSMKATRSLDNPKVAFVFSGQGAQWNSMGKELCQYEVFRECLSRADQHLSSIGAGWSVLEELFSRDEKRSRINESEYSQPLCTILQVALVDLITDWGVKPDSVVGHSSGEIAAAYTAGAITQQDAWRIAYHRGRLCSSMRSQEPSLKGKMVAVGLSPEEAEVHLAKLTSGTAVVACINGPKQITISGDVEALDQLEGELTHASVAFKRLQVDQAYHSPQMKRIEGDYLDSIKDLKNQQGLTGKVKFFSTVRGVELRDLKILSSPAYWVQNLTSPVQFSYAIDALLQSPSSTRPSTFLEIGPHPVLQTYLNQASALLNSQDPPLHASILRRHTPANTTALAAAAALWSRGIAVNLPKISQTTTMTGARLLADLPPYPWNHARTYWHESRASRAYRFRAHPRLDLLGAPTPDSSAVDRRWRNIVRAAELPWARDHRVQGSVLYPAAGMVAMVIEAGRQVAGDQGRAADVVGYEVSGVRIERAMVVPEGRGAGGLETVARLVPADGGEEAGWAFTIASRSGDEAWRVNCSGALVVRFREGDVRALAEWPALSERYRRADEAVAAADALAPSHLYEKCEKAGLQYGRTFRNITQIRASGNVATASVCVPDTAAVMPERFEFPHLVHPAALDALFQTVVLSAEDAMVPTSIGYLFVAADLPSGAGAEFRGFCQTERSGLRSTRGDIVMTDAERSGPKIVLQDVGFTSLEAAGAGDGAAQDVAKMRAKICSEYLWKPDVDLLTRGQLRNVLQDLATSDEQLVAWIDLFGHSNPESSILEISNGGTEITKKVLERLGDPKEATPRFTRFTWTSSDLDCFDRAKEELQRWEPYVSFEKLDVESELMEQGFKSGMFDLVLVERGLLRGNEQEKLRKLLRVGGKTVIYENPPVVARDGKDDAATDAECTASGANLEKKRNVVVNGNGHGFDNKRLKGGEEPSDNHHTNGVSTINSINNGEDILNGHCGNQCMDIGGLSIMPATNEGHIKREVLLINPDLDDNHQSTSTRSLTSALFELFQSSGTMVRAASLLEAASAPANKLCISLVEVESPLLYQCSSKTFQQFQQLALQSAGLLWVTKGTQLATTRPELAPVLGIFRSARSENSGLALHTLDLSPDSGDRIEHAAGVIHRTFTAIFGSRTKTEEYEFAERGGVIHVPRIVELKTMNAALLQKCGRAPPAPARLGNGASLELVVGQPGNLESLHFVQAEAQEALLPETVEVEVKANDVAFQDAVIAMGQSSCETLGFGFAGVVKSVGDGVGTAKPGDRVVGLCPGALKTVVRVGQHLVQRIPDAVSFAAAASLPVDFATAQYALGTVARLADGESILIHDTTSGLGLAVLQLARQTGIEIFAAVGSAAEHKLLEETYGISGDHIFDKQLARLTAELKRVTKNRGVDVVISSADSNEQAQLLGCVADFGRFVHVERVRRVQNTPVLLDFASRSITFSSVNLERLYARNPSACAKALGDGLALLRAGTLVPPLLASFSFSELEPAFSASFKDSSGSGNPSKTVLIANEDDVVPVLPRDEHALKMNPEACYIIVGGFGGVGKSIAGYLVKNGARHLAIISRSGAASPEDRSFMEELKRKGANVRAYASDISQRDSLKATLDRIEVEMPPIKGVINSAMALKDILFESMTHDDYQHTTAPKIQGSWNLHALLPATLDFFIMLSSVAGVAGTRGQAAYNSGNAFQVALCQHRRARRLAAVALDLTITVGVGYVADKDELMQTLKNLGVLTISEAELHALVATAVAGRAPPEVMVGISTGGLLQYNRIDEPMWSHDNRFAYIRALDVVPAPDAGAALLAAAPSLRVALPAVADLAEAAELVAEALVAKLAAALGMEVGDLDRGKPVSAYGVDSLVAVEVRNWAWREMRASVSVFELLSETPVGELAGEIAGRSGLVPEELREKGE